MIEVGKVAQLQVASFNDHGAMVAAGKFGELFVPAKECPQGTQAGDWLEVFLYRDQREEVIASGQIPYAQAGEFACLTVKTVNNIGAFLDNGMSKELLLPFAEQKRPVEEGQNVVVFVTIEQQKGRLVASTRLNKFLIEPEGLRPHQRVDLLIEARTDIGYKAIINHQSFGMVMFDEAEGAQLHVGKKLVGWVKRIRDSGKVDLSLTKLGYARSKDISEMILDLLDQEGVVELGDKSDPNDIKAEFGCSKKAFKSAVGHLLKQGKIKTEPQRLLKAD